MQIIRYPDRASWPKIVERPRLDMRDLSQTVGAILDDVRSRGDDAVKEYELKFDKARLESLEVSKDEMEEAEALVSPELKAALTLAHSNIKAFHEAERFEGIEVETCPGVRCWQRSVPIESVGLYIPGGSAPLFSTVLMLATPARIAGCREIVLTTPPSPSGKVHPAIIVAARIAGVSRIFKAGGVQAIGAMAYGTESVPKVEKIFGPGNQYVMAAKQQVSLHDVAIDMPAGPSEVCVIADEGANPTFIAADLLSQAEHGPDSQALLITSSEAILLKVKAEVERQVEALPRKEIALKALENSKLILVADIDEAIDLSNLYAPEHLILQVEPDSTAGNVADGRAPHEEPLRNSEAADALVGAPHEEPAIMQCRGSSPEEPATTMRRDGPLCPSAPAANYFNPLISKIVNAGSVFLGKYACESAGDYASGTNHTLPTHGYATAYSGVNLDSYCRKITFQHLSPEGIRSIGKAVELMAEAEMLQAHKNAMTLRINEAGPKGEAPA